MKVIKTGSMYRTYGDDLETFEKLPAKVFNLRFNKMSGFYMEHRSDFEIKEKIYGVHYEKVDKVLRSFDVFERSLGVILSGAKGIGKSLFAKMLAEQAVKIGLPVVIVDAFYPGVAAYLESIEQEVLVLFDEFDKSFGGIRQAEGEADAQASMLSLFDGTSGGKKLFVITCNDVYRLNEFLINRPGRFHYHFRFNYPSSEEIEIYLKDKLAEEFYHEIGKVVMFSKKVDLNYDCLRAIAFELNSGLPFEKAVLDLNILNMHSDSYNLTLKFTNGEVLTHSDYQIDMFDRSESECIRMYNKRGDYVANLRFSVESILSDPESGALVVLPENLEVEWAYDRHWGDKKALDKEIAANKAKTPRILVIEREKPRMYHYAV